MKLGTSITNSDIIALLITSSQQKAGGEAVVNRAKLPTDVRRNMCPENKPTSFSLSPVGGAPLATFPIVAPARETDRGKIGFSKIEPVEISAGKISIFESWLNIWEFFPRFMGWEFGGKGDVGVVSLAKEEVGMKA